MTTEDELQAILDADPTDWQTRLILADWLDDHPLNCTACRGELGFKIGAQVFGCLACKGTGREPDRAVGYRALGELQIRPLAFRMKSRGTPLWGYHSGIGLDPNRTKTASWRHVLPRVWFNQVDPSNSDDVWRLFSDGRKSCEDWVAIAFGQLASVEREAILGAGRSRLRCASALGV